MDLSWSIPKKTRGTKLSFLRREAVDCVFSMATIAIIHYGSGMQSDGTEVENERI